MPPGILVSGSRYFVRITASTGYEPKAPNRHGDSFASADALTGIITP